jgi:hypothetical protein
MNMETAQEPFEARLRRLVGRIDDPQVVADLVLHRLAEKVRCYDGLGAYEWRDGRWAIKYNKPPKDRRLRLVRKLVKDAIIDIMASLNAIMEEKEGILAWLVEGAKKYLADHSLKNNPALQNFALNMKEQWIEEMKKAQNKKPLPTRKGQTQDKKPTVI